MSRQSPVLEVPLIAPLREIAWGLVKRRELATGRPGRLSDLLEEASVRALGELLNPSPTDATARHQAPGS